MEETSTQVLTTKLQEALRCLAAYSTETSKKLHTSPLRKTIRLFKALISDKKREQSEILKAVDIISRERLYIQKLKEGTTAERSLADSLTKAIDAYNNTHDLHTDHKNIPNTHVSNFFLKLESTLSSPLPKIDLPKDKSLKFHYPEIFCPSIIKSKANIQLSQQATELFQMKAIALLERYGIATNSEARNRVKNSPIFTAVNSQTSNCTLEQQLQLFPGQTIVVMGSSELDLKTQTIQKLFPDTFYISLESNQTGFPHPSQRTGWALANQLLPECPQRADLLDTLFLFFERKKAVITALLPQTPLLYKAKNLLKLKKNILDSHKSEFIELHRQFALTLLRMAPPPKNHDEILHSITVFYDDLLNDSEAFDSLCDAHQQMREFFISKPHKALLEAIINSGNQNNIAFDYESAKDILNKTLKKSHAEILIHHSTLSAESKTSKNNFKWKYIDALGTLLGASTNQIILQYFSEDLLYAPPVLSNFEQKIQVAAYKQAEDFMDELQMDNSFDKQTHLELLYQKMKDDICYDIAILENEDPMPIATELAAYFTLRHQSL